MPDYTLYTYFRSSCSGRLRIALRLKGLDFTPVYVDLLAGEQSSDAFRSLNPSATVPLLLCHQADASDADAGLRIGQSMAALEYLDEKHATVAVDDDDDGSTPQQQQQRLLPSDARSRAVVRALANIIACDVQPVTNLRILRRLRAVITNNENGGDSSSSSSNASDGSTVQDDWRIQHTSEGLRAYEETARPVAGRFSVGDRVTLADVCLMPAIWRAQHHACFRSLESYPTVRRIVANLEEIPAFKLSHPLRQPDCPELLRIE